MQAVQVREVTKSFGKTRAVDGLSFAVDRGEVFGLLGPNGAGKTTTIRIVLDIFKADSGTVSVLGGPMSEARKERVGYMPEERGLYQDISLERCLLYLASLKGLGGSEARKRLAEYLERFDLAAHRGKKVKELSKGMQQKAQLIATILHDPDLIIIDEPFAALDPINTQMVKDLLRELRQQGRAIVMSTHQMHQAEELCDRILLMDEGRELLQGPLGDIRRRYAGHAVLVRAADALPALAGVEGASPYNNATRLALAEGTTPQEVLEALVRQGVTVESFQIAIPTLAEIFVRAVQEGGAA